MTTIDTRQNLLEAAIEVFAEKGFGGARVDEIAARAHANKAMIYYHFQTKEGLFQAVLLSLFSEAKGHLEAIAATEKDPRERLHRIYDGLVDLQLRRPLFARLMLRELAGEPLEGGAARALGGAVGVVLSTIREGVAQGLFRPVNPLLVHMNIAGMVLIYAVSRDFRARLREANPSLPIPGDDAEDVRPYIHDVLDRILAVDHGASRP